MKIKNKTFKKIIKFSGAFVLISGLAASVYFESTSQRIANALNAASNNSHASNSVRNVASSEDSLNTNSFEILKKEETKQGPTLNTLPSNAIPQPSDFKTIYREVRNFYLDSETTDLTEIPGKVVSVSFMNLPINAKLTNPTTTSAALSGGIKFEHSLRSLNIIDDNNAKVDYQITSLSKNYRNFFSTTQAPVNPTLHLSYSTNLNTPTPIADTFDSNMTSLTIGSDVSWYPNKNEFISLSGETVEDYESLLSNHVSISLKKPTKVSDLRLGLQIPWLADAASHTNLNLIRNVSSLIAKKMTSIGSIIIETDENKVYRATNVPIVGDFSSKSILTSSVNSSSKVTFPFSASAVDSKLANAVSSTLETATNTSLVGRNLIPWMVYSSNGIPGDESMHVYDRKSSNAWVDADNVIKYAIGYKTGGESIYTPVNSGARLEYEVIGVNGYVFDGFGVGVPWKSLANSFEIPIESKYSNLLGCFNDFSDWRSPTGDLVFYDSFREFLSLEKDSSSPLQYYQVKGIIDSLQFETSLSLSFSGENNTGYDRCSIASLDFIGEIGSEADELSNSLNRKISKISLEKSNSNSSLIPYSWSSSELSYLGKHIALKSFTMGDSLDLANQEFSKGMPFSGLVSDFDSLFKLPEITSIDISGMRIDERNPSVYPKQIMSALDSLMNLKKDAKIAIADNGFEANNIPDDLLHNFNSKEVRSKNGNVVGFVLNKLSEPVFLNPTLESLDSGEVGFKDMYVNEKNVPAYLADGTPFWDFITTKIVPENIGYVFNLGKMKFYFTDDAITNTSTNPESPLYDISDPKYRHPLLQSIVFGSINTIVPIAKRDQKNTSSLLNKVLANQKPTDQGNLFSSEQLERIATEVILLNGTKKENEITQEVWKSKIFWNLDLNKIVASDIKNSTSIYYSTYSDLVKSDSFNSSTGRFSATVTSLLLGNAENRDYWEEWKAYWEPKDGIYKNPVPKPVIREKLTELNLTLDGVKINSFFVKGGVADWDVDFSTSWIMGMSESGDNGSDFYTPKYFSQDLGNPLPDGELSSIPGALSGSSKYIPKQISYPLVDRMKFTQPNMLKPSVEFNKIDFGYILFDKSVASMDESALQAELKTFIDLDEEGNNTIADDKLPTGVYHAKINRGEFYFPINPSLAKYYTFIEVKVKTQLGTEFTVKLHHYFSSLHQKDGEPILKTDEEIANLVSLRELSVEEKSIDFNHWKTSNMPIPSKKLSGSLLTGKMTSPGIYETKEHIGRVFKGKWYWRDISFEKYKGYSFTDGTAFYENIWDIKGIDSSSKSQQVRSITVHKDTDTSYLKDDLNSLLIPSFNIGKPLTQTTYDLLLENAKIDKSVTSTDCYDNGRSCLLLDGERRQTGEFKPEGFQYFLWKGNIVATTDISRIQYVSNRTTDESLELSKENSSSVYFFSSSQTIPEEEESNVTSIDIPEESISNGWITRLQLPIIHAPTSLGSTIFVRDERFVVHKITAISSNNELLWLDVSQVLPSIKFVATTGQGSVYYASLTEKEIGEVSGTETSSVDLTRSKIKSISALATRRQTISQNLFLPIIIGSLVIGIAAGSVIAFEIVNRRSTKGKNQEKGGN